MSVITLGNAQNFELLDVEFNSTLNGDNSIGLKRAFVKVNIPLKLKKGVLLNSLSFTTNKIEYNSTTELNTSELENFKTIKYSVGFLNKINETWKFKAQIAPTLSSNFESNISFEDVFLNGSLIFIKATDKSKLRLGLVYNFGFGLNIPIPVLSYSRKVSDTFSYTLGIPETKLEYKLSQNDKVNIHTKPRGFYSNISNSRVLSTLEKAEKARYRAIVSGFNYTHRIDDCWNISLNTGYQFLSKYNLLNGNSEVFEFETKDNFFVGLNLKFKILNKKN
ncbi:DUF6268 family outer membrane beta-barrel protein [Lutibacter sp.]